jgi:hypothetical protein
MIKYEMLIYVISSRKYIIKNKRDLLSLLLAVVIKNFYDKNSMIISVSDKNIKIIIQSQSEYFTLMAYIRIKINVN